MSVEVSELSPKALEVEIEGKLEKTDYEKLEPIAAAHIERHGPIGLLVRVSELDGWTPAGLWEDLKFDARHYKDVSRIALVARNESREWMATVSKPFTSAEVEFYPESEIDAARRWVKAA